MPILTVNRTGRWLESRWFENSRWLRRRTAWHYDSPMTHGKLPCTLTEKSINISSSVCLVTLHTLIWGVRQCYKVEHCNVEWWRN